MRRLFALFLVVALVISSSFPGLPTLSGGAGNFEFRNSNFEIVHPGSPAPQHPSTSAPQPSSGLYRTRISVRGPADWTRLEQLGVVVLEGARHGFPTDYTDSAGSFRASVPESVSVLADDDQLEALARLRFEPQSTDELSMLVAAHAQEKPWLAASLSPLLSRAAEVEQQKSLGAQGLESAVVEVRQTVRALTLEQKAALTALTSVDDDADGLTNTQEQWWCTDPLNPDSDGDGVSDGAEVAALKDWMGNRRSGPPASGKPFAGWPTEQQDSDHDSVPDLAERWELGLNMNRESTDRDKFDDGQELFGLTKWGWGALPRAEDTGYVFAEMPSWVKAPGNHPLVAAFPVPEIDVVESSLHVQTVTTVTTDHTIASGTENSYSTAKTEGTSTSVANTVTWNDWQEVSESLQQHLLTASSAQSLNSVSGTNWGKLAGGALQIAGGVAAAGVGCGAEGFAAIGTFGIGALAAWPACAVGLTTGAGLVGAGLSDLGEAFTPDTAQANLHVNQHQTTSVQVNNQQQVVLNQSFDTTNLVRAIQGTQYAYLQSGELIASRLSDIAYLLAAPVRTTTTTNGRSWGGARTTTTEQHEDHTITSGEAFSNQESWGTATAVDSAHAADLWFTYKVRNTGTEYAREIADLAFNVYIGDDPNPAYTYFVAPDLGGDGKFHNFMPAEEHTYTARHIPLTLEQMKAVDLGGPVRIVLEDYTYGVDELFYQDAVNAGVQVAIEDGTDDGDELIDTYLIPTWGTETVLDILARYFPHTTDADGNLIAIWTPEYRSDTPSWCQEGYHTGNTLWCQHALSTADWWNVYTNGLGDGSEGFQDTPAAPGSVALFRFNQDSDLDGYSDRSEISLGTDPYDPASYPKPELIAGVHSIRSGNSVTATLSLLNTGLYDAYGVEAVMIAPDDSVSITNNTVGGSGRVRAQKQVIVGSRILSPAYTTSTWRGTAKPASGGYYTGSQDRTYTFTVSNCSNPLGCDVSSGTWSLAWNDGTGNNGTLNFGAGYASPTFLDVGSFGVKLALYSGKVYNGDTFTVEARTPRDTFQYTINREPYTEPVVIVSYNDPQGNHRFVTPVHLSSPTENLAPHSDKMLHGDADVEIVTQEAFNPAQANTTTLIAQVPPPVRLVDAHLFLEFIDPQGTVVREEARTVTLETGPNVVDITWNPADFNPVYNPSQDYIVMAFFTDWQGNILDTVARPLSSFQADPKPALALDETATTWDFGTVPQGTLLEHSFMLANTGMMNLKATVVGTGVRTDQNVPGIPPWTDTGLDVAVGDAIGIRASGTVCYCDSGTTCCYNPDGRDDIAPAGWALPGARELSLIAKIGDGAPFFVGSTYVGTAISSGRLYLGTNDCGGCYGDNGGTYQAHIEIQGVPTSFQGHPSFSVSPADATNLDITLDTYYLPAGPFNRTILVRTSDPAHPTQTFLVQGTIQPYVAPAQSMAVNPYRPWDQRVAVSGDRQYREVVTFNDTITADAAAVHPLRAYNDTQQTQLGAGREIARAEASSGRVTFAVNETAFATGDQARGPEAPGQGMDSRGAAPLSTASALDSPFGDGRDGSLVVGPGQMVYVDNVRAAIAGTAAAGQTTIYFAVPTMGEVPGVIELWPKRQWADTGLRIAAGERLRIVGDPHGHSDLYGICYAGSGNLCYDANGIAELAPDGWAAPGVRKYSLVARIGNGQPFFVGSNFDAAVSSSGRLYLGLNDCNGCFGDNEYKYGVIKFTQDLWIYHSVTPQFSAGDQVLVTQMTGDGAGRYEIATVASAGSGVINLTSPLQNTYTTGGVSKAQVLKVPQYSSVGIQNGGELTSRPWDGNSGGIIAFKVRDQLTIEGGGRISAFANGFRGGREVTWSQPDAGPGYQGESYTGAAQVMSRSANGGGGGGGQNNAGGGGGYGSPGLDGHRDYSPDDPVGLGGSTYGTDTLSQIFLGSGGGGSGHSLHFAAQGGRGSGAILIVARNVNVGGAIEANGQGGWQGNYGGENFAPEAPFGGTRDGGGGSGGSIRLVGANFTIGTNNISALGGPGGQSTDNLGEGGDGGVGRIRIEYCDTLSGSTNPSASVAKINFCYGTVSGKVFRDDNGNGSQDAGEPGIVGVTVSLSGVGQTTTDGNGNYSFTANAPANYTVSATPPAGYDCITPCNVNISLQVDQTTTVNFALRPRASISGKVFHDTNNNGVQDAGEAGIAGVTVTLNGTGQTRTTAGDGSYSFEQLLPGNYSVSVSVPDGYVNTTPTTVSCSLGAGSTCTANFGILKYTIEKVASSEHQIRLFMPESFRSGRRYWVQYGRSVTFSGSGEAVAQVKLPKVHYGTATMDVLLTQAGNSFVQINLDVGNNGTWEWGYNGSPAIPITLHTNDLAAALNAFMSNAAPGADGLVTVPLRLSLNTSGQLYLTNLVATPDGISDVSVGPADVTLNPTNPVEGDTVNVQATLHNASGYDSSGLTASFFATPTVGGGYYIGSAFVPNVSAGGTAQASISWNTLGFTGTVPVRVVADPFNRVAETNENNNAAVASLTIRTRPDLLVTTIALSDDEPVTGEPVTVTLTLRNTGQTAASASTLALYDGNPDSGGTLLGEGTPAVPGGGETTLDFTWTPTAPGPHRLFAQADRTNVVNEFDEGNNQTWQDVYVGFAGPILLDSGKVGADPAYTKTIGYGAVDEGQPDEFGNCGSEPYQTFRRDPGGRVVYRFDHLLPGHFYHLDLTLYLCGAAGRQESVYVDGNLIVGPEDLGDGRVHRLSSRLDPALYADRTISVTVETPALGGAVVNEVNLYDVDYRYSDSGGANDPPYTADRGYGYLPGSVARTQWGTLPYQSLRENQSGNSVSYRYDRLDPAKRYAMHLTFWQSTGASVTEKVQIDGVDTGTTLNLQSGTLYSTTVNVPLAYYTDGSITVTVVRTDAQTSAFVNEIALEELTLPPDNICVAPVTPSFTEVYGSVTLNGAPASVGTVVQALNPRGDTVGCFTVGTAGLYGLMRIYGEDATANPPIPGMRAGEPVAFRVNGAPAVATPLPYWQDDKASHRVNLAAGGIEGQSILLAPGWNLISLRVEPPAPLVNQVLNSISSRYDRVLGETGVYVPSLPDVYNTLKELHSKQGYYLRLTGSTSANLLVDGLPVAANSPIPLHQGWNWTGYLPTSTLPITVALQSIEGHYQRVLSLDKTYDPSLPEFSTLKEMKSGEGYLIYASTPVTLTYPAAGAGGQGSRGATETIELGCPGQPTPYATLVYGTLSLNGAPAPAGTRVEVVTPRGEVAGCFVVERVGQYGLMHVYGADNTAQPPIGGFQEGEPLSFRVNGIPASASTTLFWQDDKAPHEVDLNVRLHSIYLPLILQAR
jgi:hypothetical protein